MKRRLAILVAGTLAFWGLAAVGVLTMWDHLAVSATVPPEVALGYSLTALVLCLVPSVVTFAWTAWGTNATPEQQVLMVLGGGGLRMFCVLGVAFLLYQQVEYFQKESYWIWILVFYLFTLALEMTVLVYGRGGPVGNSK